MRNYLHILTLIAFLGGVIAPACGFSWGGNFSVIEICTAQGFETRVINNEETPDAPTPTMGGDCQFCFANANLTSFLPENISVEVRYAYAEKITYSLYEVILLSRTTRNGQPRAPPIFA